MVFIENRTVFVVSSRTDATQLSFCQCGFQQVGSIHGAAGNTSRSDNGMDFVHKQHRIRNLRQLFQHRFHPCFEVSSVLGARQQSAHIQRKHRSAF